MSWMLRLGKNIASAASQFNELFERRKVEIFNNENHVSSLIFIYTVFVLDIYLWHFKCILLNSNFIYHSRPANLLCTVPVINIYNCYYNLILSSFNYFAPLTFNVCTWRLVRESRIIVKFSLSFESWFVLLWSYASLVTLLDFIKYMNIYKTLEATEHIKKVIWPSHISLYKLKSLNYVKHIFYSTKNQGSLP